MLIEILDNESDNASIAALEPRLFHVGISISSQILSQIERIDEKNLKKFIAHPIRQFTFHSNQLLPILVQNLKEKQIHPKERCEVSNLQSNVRLPKIALPSFDVNVIQWTNYYETFTVLIHKEPSLNDLQKYQYLRSSLSGPAAAQIASLKLNAANYEVALDLLRNKYGDKPSFSRTTSRIS